VKRITLNFANFGLQVLLSWFQKKKILGKDMMHRYGVDRHVGKAKHMIRSNVILSGLYVVM
jgi:hypothetical protein